MLTSANWFATGASLVVLIEIWIKIEGLTVLAQGAKLPFLSRLVFSLGSAVVCFVTLKVSALLVGPAVGLVSVVAGVMISSRVNDPRAAQQVGTVALLPIIGVLVVESSGVAVIDARTYLLGAAIFAAAGLMGLRIAVGLFGRESILTRWR